MMNVINLMLRQVSIRITFSDLAFNELEVLPEELLPGERELTKL